MNIEELSGNLAFIEKSELHTPQPDLLPDTEPSVNIWTRLLYVVIMDLYWHNHWDVFRSDFAQVCRSVLARFVVVLYFAMGGMDDKFLYSIFNFLNSSRILPQIGVG